MSDELKPQSIDSPEFRRHLGDCYDIIENVGMSEALEYLEAQLISHINAWGARMAGVPDGWKLVPIEPTDAMCDAPEVEVGLHSWDHSRDRATWSECHDIYKAMIAVAPAPEADKEDA
jgi:hypothetical protein